MHAVQSGEEADEMNLVTLNYICVQVNVTGYTAAVTVRFRSSEIGLVLPWTSARIQEFEAHRSARQLLRSRVKMFKCRPAI